MSTNTRMIKLWDICTILHMRKLHYRHIIHKQNGRISKNKNAKIKNYMTLYNLKMNDNIK